MPDPKRPNQPSIQFPETVAKEWQIVADAANASTALRERLQRDTLVEAALEKLRVAHEAKVQFDAELQAADTPDLDMMTLSDYLSSPQSYAPQDMIEGVLNDDGVCLVVGPSRSGKSTLALQMLYCLATGEPFLEQRVNQVSGAMGILSYDMPGGLMFDWVAGYPNLDPRRVSIVNAHKRGNPLAVPEQRSAIVNSWKARNTEVVLIDSFGASFFGRNQDDAAEVQAHHRELKKFALTEVGARVVIIIVHSTDANPLKPRGSTVHIDSSDSIINYWPKDGPGTPRHVDMGKFREARGQVQMTSRVVGPPDPVTRLVQLDAGEMTLAGYPLPVGLIASVFPDVPDATAEPDLDGDSEQEKDVDL